MPAKKPSSVDAVRKPKFVDKKTKWEKKRRIRSIKRRSVRWEGDKRKKALANPLTIAPLQERKAALGLGGMIFYDGKKRVAVPLILEAPFDRGTIHYALQGVYKTKEKIVVLRTGLGTNRILAAFEIKGNGKNIGEKRVGWFWHSPSLGHMLIEEHLKKRSIGLKAASKTERSQRSIKQGRHEFTTLPKFVDLFKKLGYSVTGNKSVMVKMAKEGKHREKDNLYKYHRIEAIDPKTGKARIFTFKIQGE